MTEPNYSQKELLYNPKNWVFFALLLSPILPAIFYYRNSKLLNTVQKGRRVLIGSILYVLVIVIIISIFDYYASLITVLGAVISAVVFSQLAKTQNDAYEEMKKTKNLKGGRNDVPLALLFLLIGIMFGFVVPYVVNKYTEKNVNANYIYQPLNRVQ
ncbi:MAG TPA: hypothetical protein VJH75_02165 [Patescibacteria group bacterium]|nr:hypothetical protein [Patescibacteria group bacterium]